MALTILRTAYSGVLKDNMDYSTAFCDAQGRTVAQGLTLPGHLSSFPDALAATIRHYGDRMRPGDVYALNDPFEGGMHLPDVFILKPVFHDGRRVAGWPARTHRTPPRSSRKGFAFRPSRCTTPASRTRPSFACWRRTSACRY